MRWACKSAIVLWAACSGTLSANPDCDQELAERGFSRCAICHSSEPGAGHGVGPNLHGIVGREIASHEDFFYSDALASIDGSWTADRLDAFLADPAAFAPGTTMGFGGLPAARERAAVICELATGGGSQ